MKVGIHPDEGTNISKFSQKYLRILQYNEIDYVVLNIDDPEFWNEFKRIDYFIFRWGHAHNEAQRALSFLPIIERETNTKVFPNHQTCWHFDDKIRQYYLLKYHDFPVIDSFVFWNKEKAIDFASTTTYPIVLKLKGGAGSSNVKLIRSQKEAVQHINLLFDKGIKQENFYEFPRIFSKKILLGWLRKLKVLGPAHENYWQVVRGYAYFQEFLPDNPYDIRITTIGNRAFGFTRNNRPGDFRASGSGSIFYDLSRIDLECVKLAMKISKKLGFQSMSYDFLYDKEKNIRIGEISYTYQDKAVYNCPGYWDENLNWHEGHYWPQYCQLVDLLGLTDLVQPEMK